MDRDDEEISPAVDYLGTDEDPRIDFEGAQEAMWSHETERIKYLAVASDQGQQQRICIHERARLLQDCDVENSTRRPLQRYTRSVQILRQSRTCPWRVSNAS
jgi:hypothetical protein